MMFMEQGLHRLYFLLNFDLSSWPLISLWGTRIVKVGLRIKIHYAIAKNILDFRNAEAYLYKSFKTSGPSLIVLIGLLPYYKQKLFITNCPDIILQQFSCR